MFQMVADPTGIAHSTRCNDDMKSGELGDRFAFLHRLSESEMRRTEQTGDVDIWVKTCGMVSENLRGTDRERRI